MPHAMFLYYDRVVVRRTSFEFVLSERQLLSSKIIHGPAKPIREVHRDYGVGLLIQGNLRIELCGPKRGTSTCESAWRSRGERELFEIGRMERIATAAAQPNGSTACRPVGQAAFEFAGSWPHSRNRRSACLSLRGIRSTHASHALSHFSSSGSPPSECLALNFRQERACPRHLAEETLENRQVDDRQRILLVRDIGFRKPLYHGLPRVHELHEREHALAYHCCNLAANSVTPKLPPKVSAME